jgi:hypothetical protein
MRNAGCRLVVASVLLIASCSRVASFRPTQLAALQGLAANREVMVQDDEGEELKITRSTRLTFHVPGYAPIESRPELLGFSATSLRLGAAFDQQAPVLEYARIARVDARVRNMTATLLAIFIPVGVLLSFFLVCSIDGSCPGE